MSVRAWVIALVFCGVAGAISCTTKSRPVPPPEIPSRREIQRASYRAEEWQFVVCSDELDLRSYLDSLAAANPSGKRVKVVACADYEAGKPAIVFGHSLPEALGNALSAVAIEELGYKPGDFLLLSNYLVKAPQPSTFTLYLSEEKGAILDYLRTADFSDWGGVFRGRWAYEITKPDGSRRLGDYAGRGWEFATDEEINLSPVGSPIYDSSGVAYYSFDEAISADRLRELFITDSLLPLADSLTRSVYLYPSVERIGLRRGSMSMVQRQGSELHLVYPNEISAGTNITTIPKFLKGMTFAHEGYRIYNGYGGSMVAPSLDSLIRLNVNAVAIVPYTFMRSPDQTGELPVPDGPGSENDAAVTYSIRQAQQRGLTVLLKPQIWVGGAWPGDVRFDTEAEWDDFFDKYSKWIGHYAVMAETERVAALCIGTELVHATLDHPERWREMIAELRKVYSGKLTYAANWGREFEQLTFWKDLDVVGLNSYYPLSFDKDATDENLLAGATNWMRLADSISTAANRPLWLTEVGYRSVDGAWMNPHAEVGDRPVDYDAQRRCYTALLQAARQSERLRGMFIWKWPSYLDYRDHGNDDSGYVPGGKPAGLELARYYGE